MKTASAIICLIAALLGLATSLFTLLTGGTASLFGATGAQEMVNFGWVGLTASLAAYHHGGVDLQKQRKHAIHSVRLAGLYRHHFWRNVYRVCSGSCLGRWIYRRHRTGSEHSACRGQRMELGCLFSGSDLGDV